jgi:hypothetical protein
MELLRTGVGFLATEAGRVRAAPCSSSRRRELVYKIKE